MTAPITTVELRSLMTTDGELRLTLDEVPLPGPGPDHVIVRVEAAPINPTDLGGFFGPADLTTLCANVIAERPVTTARIPAEFAASVAGRVGRHVSLGLEGAGTVIDAGANARNLIGRVVSAAAGGMFTHYRTLPADAVLAFPDGVSPRQAAGAYVNPLTALGMLSTMRLEGHTALVHTAAASNLGLMLNKLCRSESVELVNVVRTDEQVDMLRSAGAEHVVSSTHHDFRHQLIAAVGMTVATLAFDAVGGGPLAGEILVAMESALLRRMPATYQYGSAVNKQVYIYGRLDTSSIMIPRGMGMAWGVGGWLLSHHLKRVGPDGTRKLQNRVTEEIATTFASSYGGAISLVEALDPNVIRRYAQKATGQKYLIEPWKDVSPGPTGESHSFYGRLQRRARSDL